MKKKKIKRAWTRPKRETPHAKYLKNRVLATFRKLKEDLIELGAEVGPQEAMKFGMALVTLSTIDLTPNMKF